VPILSPSDAAKVREMLAELPGPVRLVFFTQTPDSRAMQRIPGPGAEVSDERRAESLWA
jgi:hypothetical protein